MLSVHFLWSASISLPNYAKQVQDGQKLAERVLSAPAQHCNHILAWRNDMHGWRNEMHAWRIECVNDEMRCVSDEIKWNEWRNEMHRWRNGMREWRIEVTDSVRDPNIRAIFRFPEPALISGFDCIPLLLAMLICYRIVHLNIWNT